jgi:sialate O-acetylesterase
MAGEAITFCSFVSFKPLACDGRANVTRIGFVSLLFSIAFTVTTCAQADVKLASVFSDNMVLQRDERLPIWGTADAGLTVEVAIGDKRASAVADTDGNWNVVLDAMPANVKPLTLKASTADKQVTLSNILVGDVWLCSGQSNMQLPLREVFGGDEFANAHGDSLQIRLLMVPKQFTEEPRTEQAGKWAVCTPKDAGDFSAVGFSFAALLAQTTKLSGVPIGVIDSSFGGTAVEGWIPKEDLARFDAKDIRNSLFGGPSQHYNPMIAPLVPMAIKGVLWYQGESNADHSASYAALLSAMIDSWRKRFDNPQLPFIIIQLPSYNAKLGDNFFSWVREAQSKVAASATNVGLVVTYDTNDGSDLHPKEKIPIGHRAVRAAQKMVYGEDLLTAGPVFQSESIDGSRVLVTFDTKGDGLATKDNSALVRGFMLAGADGIYRFAEAAIEGNNRVVVSATSVPSPKTVRFAWAGAPDANLTNKSGLPADPFRTDNLPPIDVAFVKVPTTRAVKTSRYEIEISGQGSITSLGALEQQFISNDFGADGGSCIPAFLAPRSLNQVAEVGPTELSFRDNEVSLGYTFEPDIIEMTLKNGSKEEITFQIALDKLVEAEGTTTFGLSRGKAKLSAKGFDRFEKLSNGKSFLKVKIPAGDSTSMKLELTH